MSAKKWYLVSFTRTQECSVLVRASDPEEAKIAFTECKYSNDDLEVNSETDSVEDIQEDEELN